MHMIGLQDSGESGDKVQDDSTTTKHTVSQKIRVDTTLKNQNIIPINEFYNGYQRNYYHDQVIGII